MDEDCVLHEVKTGKYGVILVYCINFSVPCLRGLVSGLTPQWLVLNPRPVHMRYVVDEVPLG